MTDNFNLQLLLPELPSRADREQFPNLPMINQVLTTLKNKSGIGEYVLTAVGTREDDKDQMPLHLFLQTDGLWFPIFEDGCDLQVEIKLFKTKEDYTKHLAELSFQDILYPNAGHVYQVIDANDGIYLNFIEAWGKLASGEKGKFRFEPGLFFSTTRGEWEDVTIEEVEQFLVCR